MMWSAKIAISMPMPICTDNGGYIVQPPAGAPPGTKNELDQQQRRRRQQPEAPVVHAREGHVRRADHHRNLPVGEPDERRHDGAEHHDQAVHGGQLVEKLGLNDLQAGLEQLGPDGQRHHAPGQEHDEAEPQIHRADVFVVGGAYPAHAGRSDDES